MASLQFPETEHSLLPFPPSVLKVVFKPLPCHQSVLGSAISTVSLAERGKMASELIHRILRGIP